MGQIDIKIVENSQSRYYRDFIKIPFAIYQGQPNWVPWFDKDMIAFIDRLHPLFEHSTGDFFVAMKGSRPVGRIFVFENTRYNKTHSLNSACFYFIDFIDDGEVAAKLFQAAIDWAKNRSLDGLMGPMGLGGVTGVGVLAAGFEHRAAMKPADHAQRNPGMQIPALHGQRQHKAAYEQKYRGIHIHGSDFIAGCNTQ